MVLNLVFLVSNHRYGMYYNYDGMIAMFLSSAIGDPKLEDEKTSEYDKD